MAYELPHRRQQLTDEQALVLEVALAIEDPASEEAVKLARSLIELGKCTPKSHRRAITALCEVWVRSFRSGEID